MVVSAAMLTTPAWAQTSETCEGLLGYPPSGGAVTSARVVDAVHDGPFRCPARLLPGAGDGAGAPVMDHSGPVGTQIACLIQANTSPDGERLLETDDAALIGDAVLAQCDAADGEEDGAVADPGACEVDLRRRHGRRLSRRGGTAALAARPESTRTADGTQLYPAGIILGSEAFRPVLLTGTDSAAPLLDAFTGNVLAHLACSDDPGAGHDPRDFDLATAPARMAAAATYNGEGPGSSAFHAARDEAVSRHMIPGLDLCGIQSGPPRLTHADLDPLTAMEAWLDTGTPPEMLRAR
ncbi:Tannase and feruloyl esterase [Jannaschia rubra]|uniref:Tannase and feruloyl esterase n=2 Tax=Jannaschia rubra TaxID=282197 RepID=A0A0M6XWM3_9RHOB|nr:Tannase and feruloyl esterase [Jannaschia rubra]SFG64679.1 Tannase and feruloyl esterase [Jannaschia rubra]